MIRTKQRLYKSSINRTYKKKGMHKFQEAKSKIIRYINRTYDELVVALMKLKDRYKTVKLVRKLVHGLYQGQFECTI